MNRRHERLCLPALQPCTAAAGHAGAAGDEADRAGTHHDALSRQRWRRAAASALLLLAMLWSGLASAQVPPTLFVDDASVFEGNTGTRILILPVRFVGAQPNTVTGTVSVIGLTGAGFSPATGGTACGPGIDFVQFTNVPFSIPPNTPNGTLSVNIAVCGDAAVEPNEHLFVSFANIVGAQCFEGTCNALGTVLDDDGPPGLSINSISVSEPVALGATRTASFTVSLDRTINQPVSVNFATRNGSARASCQFCSPAILFGDYRTSAGSVTIDANTPSKTFSVTVLGDELQESSETFFVDLSAPVNAVIAVGTGRASIQDTTLFIGGFELGPDDARLRSDEQQAFSVNWTVPDNLVWRNLKSIDLRLRGGHGTALWVRWDEASNRFSLCQKSNRGGAGHAGDDGGDDDDGDHARHSHAGASRVVCTPGELPGSAAVLSTPLARLHMAGTTVIGSGPTGQSVELKLMLSLTGRAAGHSYRLELAAADDFGNLDAFVRASELRVLSADRRRAGLGD